MKINIKQWNEDDVEKIYNELEKPNRAPRLASNIETMQKRSTVFPEGHIVGKIWEELIASLSTNRIDRDGKIWSLWSWDDVAGDPSDYSQTYKLSWNTLVMMSMNVSKNHIWKWVAKQMIDSIKEIWSILEVENIIWSFRPNEFWKHKLISPTLTFEEYIHLKRKDWRPVDKWLRSLQKNWMKYLKIDNTAMQIEVSQGQLSEYQKKYNPKLWLKHWDHELLCGETWSRNTLSEQPMYTESNLRWHLPFTK